jgi:hypothetical protein
MGCAGSKSAIKASDDDAMIRVRQATVRLRRENVEVDNGAVYSGEFFNGLKDGQGTQRCMLTVRNEMFHVS